MRPTALVTNDDGIDSPGVHALALLAQDAGFDVLLAAPVRQSSGSASGIGFERGGTGPLVTDRPVDGLAGRSIAVDAQPAMIALLAMTGQFGVVPDLVLSGVNDASNLGSGVLHSGTAGAAITAAAHGATAVAISLYCDEQPDSAPRHWSTATQVLSECLGDILASPRGAAFNINVPNVAALNAPLTPARWDTRGCVPSLVPFLQAFHERNGSQFVMPDLPLREGSDRAEVRAGHPTISCLRLVDGGPKLISTTPTTHLSRSTS